MITLPEFKINAALDAKTVDLLEMHIAACKEAVSEWNNMSGMTEQRIAMVQSQVDTLAEVCQFADDGFIGAYMASRITRSYGGIPQFGADVRNWQRARKRLVKA